MKILGLDLGVGSVGWAVIETDEKYNPKDILGMGSRIVSLTPDESRNFTKGKGETVCASRTAARTSRKMLDRFQMRRDRLNTLLKRLGMFSENYNVGKTPLEVWQLRADAATQGRKLTLKEIGNVLRHLNSKRGYRHSKADTEDGKQTKWVKNVNTRWKELQNLGETPGQNAARLLKETEIILDSGKKVYTYRIKDKNDRVLPRQAYEAEFDIIMDCQSKFWPDVLTPENIQSLKTVIFYQRPLKSCKHLVSICEFESKVYTDKNGRKVVGGPKVAPRTSPLAQLCHIYETVNNITLVNPLNKRKSKSRALEDLYDFPDGRLPKEARLLQHQYELSPRERNEIAKFLWTHDKMTETDLLKILGLKKADGFKVDGNVGKGIQGNLTYCQLRNALERVPDSERLLKFDILLHDSGRIDQETGEIVREVDPSYMDQPLYKLWHLVYSSSTRDELAKNLASKYNIEDEETVDALFAIDFTKQGFANKSAKFMRRILPYLMEGLHYSEAAMVVGINHSDSLTKEENLRRELLGRLPNLKKGELRQPTVEKILNQMINVVNAVMEKWGRMDEIRVELARELKQSKEKRAQTTADLSKRESENKALADYLNEYGVRASRRNIQKLRLYNESGGTCIYCGQPVSRAEFLGGHGGEIEHIIPRSLLFDDSFSNKVCSHRSCNHEKGQRTGYDYMCSKGEDELASYVCRVTELFKNGTISRTKRDRLLCEGSKIPEDFIERDLRQSQYIAKKSREILREVCYDVNASSGSVTDFFRHAWGYDMILHNLNIDRYSKADLVSDFTYEHEGQTHSERRIADWTKRNDHRHHAIDALVIALTRQGYIQHLNNLSQHRDEMYSEATTDLKDLTGSFHLLEKWAATRPHFPVSAVAQKTDEIVVSFKPGKKLTTPGKRVVNKGGRRVVMQTGLRVPRGPLHQETIYGKIKILDGPRKLKDALSRLDLIVDSTLRVRLQTCLYRHDGDIDATMKYLKKNPILDGKEGMEIKTVDCFREEYVRRVDVASVEYKNISKILDKAVREAVQKRYEENGKDPKKFQQSLTERPITVGTNPPRNVYTVRCSTGLKDENMVETRKQAGKAIGYAKSGNNHHVAFYQTPDGKVETMVTSMWTAVKREKLGLQVIIVDPAAAADRLTALPSSPDVEEVGRTLPLPNRRFLFSLRMNEMVILGLSAEQIADARASNDLRMLTNHLYRVQKLTAGQYVFRLHVHPYADTNQNFDKMELFKMFSSYKAMREQNITRVTINTLGEINFQYD